MKEYAENQVRLFCNEAQDGDGGEGAAGAPAAGEGGEQELGNQDGAGDGGGDGDGGGEQVTPESVMLYDQHGRVLGNGVPGTGEQGDGIVLANASTALATTPVQRLTTYVNGLPMQPVEQLADFFCPRVEAGLVFDYEILDQDNQFAKIEDDVVGHNGLPGVVVWDADSTATKRLVFRGLETPYAHTDQQLDSSVPGRSIAQGENRRARRLRYAIERGRLARIVTLIAATDGSEGTLDFSSDNDPITALKTEITSMMTTCPVPREWIKINFGSGAWDTLTEHAYLTGGGNFARQMVTREQVAKHLEIPVENINISMIQAATNKQGKTAAKVFVISTNTVQIFVSVPNPQDDGDPSWAKTFCMKLNGQWMFAYRNTTHQGLNVYNVGLAYYELLAATYANGLARYAVSTD